MVCVRCGGAIRLDMIAKAVYMKLAWRNRTDMPKVWLASDLVSPPMPSPMQRDD